MKKFRYIIATLFVVAISAGMFCACEKEETTENSSVSSTSNKIQKDGDFPLENTFFFYETAPSIFYWVNEDTVAWTTINAIYLYEGNQKGHVYYDEKGKFKGFTCVSGGDNCGLAQERDNDDNIIHTGKWCKDESTGMTYVGWDAV